MKLTCTRLCAYLLVVAAKTPLGDSSGDQVGKDDVHVSSRGPPPGPASLKLLRVENVGQGTNSAAEGSILCLPSPQRFPTAFASQLQTANKAPPVNCDPKTTTFYSTLTDRQKPPSAAKMSGPPVPAPAPTSSQTPKGILKKPKSPPSLSAPPPSEPTPLPRERQIAIQQAELLLRQRGEEIKPPVPLEIFERLSQFPETRSPSTSAAKPSPDDVREFVEAVRDFLPREYQDLIEERNCLGNCGYTLCPRPRRKYTGPFKILPSGIAKVADVNMWCSDACARRALFIKVQLDNPSYVKKDGQMVVKIELADETKQSTQRQPQKNASADADESELAKSVDRLEVDKKVQTTKDNAALAVERGDARRPAQQVEVTIREKSTTVPAQAPNRDQADQDVDAHLMLEGHKTTFGTTKDDADSDSDDADDYLPSAIRF